MICNNHNYYYYLNYPITDLDRPIGIQELKAFKIS